MRICEVLYFAFPTCSSEDETDAGRSQEETDRIPRQLFVERYHIACFAISILSYIFDIGSDFYVGITHYQAGRVSQLFFSLPAFENFYVEHH